MLHSTLYCLCNREWVPISYDIQPLFKKGAHELPEIIKTCSIALQYCNEWLVPVPSQSFDGLKNR